MAASPGSLEKRKRPHPEARSDIYDPQKKLRRSERILHAQEAPQLQINTVSKHTQALDEGSRLNRSKRKAIQPAAHTSAYDTHNQSKRRRVSKDLKSRQRNYKQLQEIPPSPPHRWSERPSNHYQTLLAPDKGAVKEARIEFWSENGTWPTDRQEATMDRFRELFDRASSKRRLMSRKRSNASLTLSDATSAQTSAAVSRDQKCAPYKHPLFELQLEDAGGFMGEHELGVTTESAELCHQLLSSPQNVPDNSLFSEDKLYMKTCERLKGENEAKVLDRVSRLIVPSAEILADRGAKHLAGIRETINSCWTNCEPFINLPTSGSGSRSGPRPQPDFGFGFDRGAFNAEQRQKLQPFLGDLLTDYSLFAATYKMYFPFLTCEVKCGAGGLDVADRQNAYSQSVILRGLYWLFQLVGREKELHSEINGFSISHDDVAVRIWGHYAFIDGKDVKFYRHPIENFIFAPPSGRDQRWKAYQFVKNIYDLWLPNHFKRICSAIDMLPADLSAYQDVDSMRSGLSQQLTSTGTIDEREMDGRPTDQLATPETTIETEPRNPRKKKK